MEITPSNTPPANIEFVSGIDDSTLDDIKVLDDSIMPEAMQYEREDLRSCFESEKGIHVLIKNSEGKIVGYLTSLPKDEEYADLHTEDPDFTKDESSLYVESIVIKDGDFATARSVLNAFMGKVVEKGYKNVSMHVRVSQGLSDILQKRYGAKFYRRIENWYGFGEPFDYLEIDLSNIKK